MSDTQLRFTEYLKLKRRSMFTNDLATEVAANVAWNAYVDSKRADGLCVEDGCSAKTNGSAYCAEHRS